MRLTESQVGNLTNLLDVMFTEESVSLAFAGKFGTDTLEELWNLRNSLYDYADDEADFLAGHPVDEISFYNPDEGVVD